MWDRRSFLKALGVSFGTCVAGVAYALGYGPMQRPAITRYRLVPEGWPSDFPLRIVALADIHACEPWMSVKRIEGIVAQANALKPDIIVLLGDYVAGMKRWRIADIPSHEWAAALSGLSAPLGVHAILGNHDWWDDHEAQHRGGGMTIARSALEAVHIPVYENEAKRIVHNGRGFWLAGLADQLALLSPGNTRGRRILGLDDQTATLTQIRTSEPAILMAHEPDIIPAVSERFCLTLCGHTHGGQVNIFGWRPVSASNGSRLYPYGHFTNGNRNFIVSGGLGCSIAPIRVGVAPELLLIELGVT